MDSKDLLLDSLDKRGAAYREKLKLCRAEPSKEAIHDLRTSIRRLLATLEVVAFITSASRVEKLSDRLKDQLDDSSDLRDIQVMVDKISEDTKVLPELEPFQAYLEKREKRKQRTVEKHIQDLKLGGVDKRLLKIQGAVEDLSADGLNNKLPQAVDEAYLKVMQRYAEIDPGQLASIHHLRVAFKNFRYMVEAIHPCLPDFPEAQLTRMHDYQTQMGDIHDTQVLLETLTEFAEDSDSYDPKPVRRFYEKALTEAVSVFLKDKDKMMTFWRTTPLVAFPWQGKQNKKEE
jgi:CHAD domain-containing protein